MIYDKVLELVELIPDVSVLKKTTMIDSTQYKSKAYLSEICEFFEIPFIPDFVDIDTFTCDENQKHLLRVQGYMTMFLTKFRDYSDEQMDFIILLAKEYATWSLDSNGNTRMEIWNYRKEFLKVEKEKQFEAEMYILLNDLEDEIRQGTGCLGAEID